jgi:nickel transport protein
MHPNGKAICNLFKKHRKIPFFLVFTLFLTLTPSVYGHKVYLFAWIEGDKIFTQSYFRGKKRVSGGLIRVFNPSGKVLVEGKTDKKGEFSFKIPQKTDLRIVLDDTMGHRAEYLVKGEEIHGIEKSSEPVSKEIDSNAPSSNVVQTDMKQIKMLMEKLLDSRLKPISRTLAKIQEERGPGLTEIIGGIGYIFGIMGLILYLKSKKER